MIRRAGGAVLLFLAWMPAVALGAAEAFFALGWRYYGRYAAENARAAEDAFAAGYLFLLVLPLFLAALFGAACAARSLRRKKDGPRPEDER